MAEEAQERSVKQEAADPYGDVALGVECAWPQTLPVALVGASDSRDMRNATEVRFHL